MSEKTRTHEEYGIQVAHMDEALQADTIAIYECLNIKRLIGYVGFVRSVIIYQDERIYTVEIRGMVFKLSKSKKGVFNLIFDQSESNGRKEDDNNHEDVNESKLDEDISEPAHEKGWRRLKKMGES